MADPLILYFDRCVGTAVPESLRRLGLQNVYHHHIDRVKVGLPTRKGQVKLFADSVTDPEWLEFIGARGWVAITKDYRLHRQEATLAMIRHYKVPVFYLADGQATKWAMMRVFARGYERIVRAAQQHPRPFVIRVSATGQLHPIKTWGSSARKPRKRALVKSASVSPGGDWVLPSGGQATPTS